ncbi:hypothetical protein C2E23DRAFT_889428 [Lenzites betulinus]|nr:hypothetical protein C2E23DRAFT_889428 [Lenzites betulinus]
MKAVPNWSSSTASLPARVMDPSTERMYKQYSASFNRHSESQASLHRHARASGLSTSPTGSVRCALARKVSIVAPVETQSYEDELEAPCMVVCSAPSAGLRRMLANERSWSYSSETFTYPIPPCKPKISKHIEKRVIDSIEQAAKIEIEEYKPIKRFFLFGSTLN